VHPELTGLLLAGGTGGAPDAILRPQAAGPS
jgi:hypothetical protein